MEVVANYEKDDLERIGKTLKFHGMKEVPMGEVIRILVENRDTNVLKWVPELKDLEGEVEINFKKYKDKQSVNSFVVKLEGPEIGKFQRYNPFDFGNTLTLGQNIKMAQGMAICRKWQDKKEGKLNGEPEGDPYYCWAMFGPKEKNNPKIIKYPNYNVSDVIAKYPVDWSLIKSQYLLEDLQSGKWARFPLTIDGRTQDFTAAADPVAGDLKIKDSEGKEVMLSLKVPENQENSKETGKENIAEDEKEEKSSSRRKRRGI